MRRYLKTAAVALVALALMIVSGCGGGQPKTGDSESKAGRDTITVGSKIDTEGELLATVIELALEDAGFKVNDRSQTGTTEVVREALLSGEIEIYPEYTGSGLLFFEGKSGVTLDTFRDPQKGYETSKKLDEANGIVWLAPARANNTWAVATKREFAEANGMRTMSDFAEYAGEGGKVKLAASDEFFNNVDAWPAFAQAYGIDLSAQQRVTFSGGNTAQTEKAVAEGTEGVNFGMAYGTDGALADLGLVVLEDDKKAQLVYWPTPIIRGDVLEKNPEIADILKPAFESLTLERLQELNSRIQVKGEDVTAVAREYLTSEGLLGK